MLSDDAKRTSIAVPIVWMIRSKTFVLSASNERHWSKDLYKIQAAIGRSWLKPTSCMTHWSKASWFSWNHKFSHVNTISFPPTMTSVCDRAITIKVLWCLLWQKQHPAPNSQNNIFFLCLPDLSVANRDARRLLSRLKEEISGFLHVHNRSWK